MAIQGSVEDLDCMLVPLLNNNSKTRHEVIAITDQSAGTLLTKASHDGRTLDSHLQDWSAAYTGISHELPTSAVFLPHPIGLLAFGSDEWPVVSISLEKACSKRCQYYQFFRNARLWRKYLQGTPMIEDVNIDVDEFRFDAHNFRRRKIDDLGDFLRLLINTLSHIREGRPDLQVVDIEAIVTCHVRKKTMFSLEFVACSCIPCINWHFVL